MSKTDRLAILGAGNIGTLIAAGLVRSGRYGPADILLTRRKLERLESLAAEGFQTGSDNGRAVEEAAWIVLAVEPQQLDDLLDEIAPAVGKEHTIISVVSGVNIEPMRKKLAAAGSVVRVMPNTGISIGESMTCIAGEGDDEAVERVAHLFESVGKTLIIDEEQMIAATSLGACGVAFFLRAIRAASQGGIEIGFHADTALAIAAQTARAAATLILENDDHPEFEIDRVTTPRGCTISGLNQMEHEGFSSAMIKGIVTSSEKAAQLYRG